MLQPFFMPLLYISYRIIPEMAGTAYTFKEKFASATPAYKAAKAAS